MGEINFLDLDNINTAKVLMKLSTLNYEKKDNSQVVVHLDHYNVVVNSFNGSLTEMIKWKGYDEEPICKNLSKLIIDNQGEAIGQVLDRYINKYQVKGENLQEKEFVKFYYVSNPTNIVRNQFGRSWINYDSQLKNGSAIIHDSADGYGIWAMYREYADYKQYPMYLERYGNNIMVLKAISDENYIDLGNQIVGPKYKVIKKYAIND